MCACPGSARVWNRYSYSKKCSSSSPSALLLSSPSPSSDVHFGFVRALFSQVKWDIPKWKPPSDVWTWTATVHLYTLWRNKQESVLNQPFTKSHQMILTKCNSNLVYMHVSCFHSSCCVAWSCFSCLELQQREVWSDSQSSKILYLQHMIQERWCLKSRVTV